MYMYANGVYFELRRACVFLMYLRFLKKSVLKLLDHTVYVRGYDCHNPFFPLLVHLAHNRHMLILATWWEQWTCTNIGHLSFSHRSSEIVTHVNTSTIFYLRIKFKLFSFPRLVYNWQADKYVVCVCVSVWTISIIHIPWPSTRIVRIQSQWTGEHLASVPHYEYLPQKPVVPTVWYLFAPETSRANSLLCIHLGSCMAGVIPKSLHFQAQVMLASLAWRNTSTECAKSCA